MQLLTRQGALHGVSKRSNPLGGIDVHQIRSAGTQAIPLSRLPSGETRMLAVSRVYRTNPVIFACVHLLCRGLSSIKLKSYKTESTGERRQVRCDVPPTGGGRPPAGVGLARLLRQPAPRVSQRKLVFRTVHDTAVFGNALNSFHWGPYGPDELWPIPWRRVILEQVDPMTVDRWDVRGAAGTRTLAPEEVVHYTWGDDPESPIGVSPIESLSYTIALHNAIDRHLVSYYGNAARPSGVLTMSKAPQEKDIELVREQFRQLYTAPESAGNVVLTSGQYTPIAEQTGVPTLVELIRLSREEIFGVYGVDPPMIGILENAIKANISEVREKYVLDTLGPWAKLFEDEMWAQMISVNPLWDYHWAEFDLEDRLRPDLETRAKINGQMSETLSVNERRRKENVPDLPYPEADTVWIGSGKIPLGFGTPTTTTDLNPDPPIDGSGVDGSLDPETDPSGSGEEGADDIDDDPDDDE